MARTVEEQRVYERDKKRRQRARARGESVGTSVSPLRAVPDLVESEAVDDSPNESAVLVEVARLPTVGREADVQAALAMARILDDKAWRSLHPQAAARLKMLMDGLRAGEVRESSPLVQLRARRSAR